MSGLPSLQPPLPLHAVAALLGATLAAVRGELAALGDEAGWHPEPAEWCANEVVGDLVEAEGRGFAGRIRTMLDADRPTLTTWDQAAMAASRGDCDKPATDLIAAFESVRDESVRLVAALRDDDLRRAGLHPVVGPLTVADLLAEWVHHDRNHVRQLLAVTQARVWGQMGNARRFTDV